MHIASVLWRNRFEQNHYCFVECVWFAMPWLNKDPHETNEVVKYKTLSWTVGIDVMSWTFRKPRRRDVYDWNIANIYVNAPISYQQANVVCAYSQCLAKSLRTMTLLCHRIRIIRTALLGHGHTYWSSEWPHAALTSSFRQKARPALTSFILTLKETCTWNCPCADSINRTSYSK